MFISVCLSDSLQDDIAVSVNVFLFAVKLHQIARVAINAVRFD